MVDKVNSEENEEQPLLGRSIHEMTITEPLPRSSISDMGKQKDEGTLMEKWHRLFPTGFKYELNELMKLSWPMILTALFSILLNPVALMFSGHLGKLELDAVAMAVSLANMVASSIGIGLLSACDTFFSQSYGSTNKKQVGIYLQTSFYISTMMSMVAWAIIFNTNNILLALGQDPQVAKMTEDYLLIYIPAIIFMFVFNMVCKWLQVQGIVIPSVLIGLVVNLIHAGFQYVCVYALEMGYRGSAVAQVLAYFILALLTIGYVICSKNYKTTWGGWSRSAFLDWGEFTKLGISSMFMVCLEWWAFEIATFLMGILGPTELGASSILFQLYLIFGSVPIGIGAACSIRIGRYLGSKKPEGAMSAARVALLVSWILAIVAAVLFLSLHSQLPHIFTSDPDVLKLTSELIPILAIFAFFGSTKWIGVGVVRGTGKQVVGGLVSFVSYFIFAMPIGIPLMFLTAVRAAGFWWGLNIGLVIASTVFLIIVLRTDWNKEMELAQLRAKTVEAVRNAGRSTLDNLEDYHENSYLMNNDKTAEDASAKLSQRSPLLIVQSSISMSHEVTSYQASLVTSVRVGVFREYGRKFWIWTYIKRLFAFGLVLAILVFGIICRFVLFIPPELPPLDDNTTTTGASIDSTDLTNFTLF